MKLFEKLRLFLYDYGTLAEKVEKSEATEDESISYGCLTCLLYFVAFLIVISVFSLAIFITSLL